MSAHSGEERLGPYRLREQLGEGGMGVVYLASDPGDRLVAIKVLRQGVPAEATARRRLAREVETMQRVHSPFVAEVVDADVENSPPYIVTRYVAGRTLEDVVTQDGPLTGPALARLCRGLAAALAAVHSAGVVHRDLKPANVMLVDGEPVVIDFGIAQAPDSTRLTMTGMFMGTPGYLAPEVIEGRASGTASDVHSWAATIAFAATGRPPFGTGQFEAVFYRIVHGQPELDGMPAPLLPVVLSALARDPSRRPSADDLTARVAGLSPETLVPSAAGAAAAAVSAANRSAANGPAANGSAATPAAAADGAGHVSPLVAGAAAAGVAAAAEAGPARTAMDLSPQPHVSGLAAQAAPAWPGTRPIAVQPGQDDFADLLTPVRYESANGNGFGAAQGAPPMPGQFTGAAWPAGQWPGSPGQYPQGQYPPGQYPPGQFGGQLQPAIAGGPAGAVPRAGAVPAAGTGAAPGRLLLVLATVAVLVAVSVLLPVAGVAAALAVVALLRAADVTTRWLGRRRSRQGPRRGDAVSATAFYPWAVCRSVLGMVVLAPFAVLCAAVVALLTVLATGPTELPRAVAYAAGALVACYCLGPGSRACRQPLSSFYGRVTRSGPAALIGSLGLAALAVGVVAAAATLAPGYWPAEHLGNQLQAATLVHPLSHLSANAGDLGRRLMHWITHRL